MKTNNLHKWGRRTALTALFLSLSLLSFATDTTRPWTFWYWMYGAVSKPGIKADLQAMKDVGPAGYEGYYEDIACFAIPSDKCSLCVNPASLTPKVTYSPNVTRDENGTFRASEPCWIQYEYPEVVTFRSVEIIPSGNNI